jgi:type VI protein secretion system component Hcp
MRTIILLLFLIPVFASAQKQDVFIRLTDAGGKQINGDAVVKGFERWMQGLSTNSGGKNNTQFSFTMNITGASADLKRALANGEILLTGQVNVMQMGMTPQPLYTIKMEKIRVLSCAEAMGCNGTMTTTVSLQATRIGWTYYQTGKTGAPTVSNKYGYDSETGGSWTNF